MIVDLGGWIDDDAYRRVERPVPLRDDEP